MNVGEHNDPQTKPGAPEETSLSAPEPLSATETARIVSQAYEIVGPRIGSIFVEANNVLTFSGERGQTEFFINNPTSEDVEKIKFSKTLENKGISIKIVGKPFKSPKGVDTLMVNVESLRGYERVSKMTKIPGFTYFNASSGWEGLSIWYQSNFRSLEKVASEENSPFSKDAISDLVLGVVKGYPDIAIYDLVEWIASDRKNASMDTEILHVSLYGGAEPNFLYSPDHRNDPTIIATVNRWGEMLGDFYKTAWHKAISKNPQFIDARSTRTKHNH